MTHNANMTTYIIVVQFYTMSRNANMIVNILVILVTQLFKVII